jgi:hypothetical protein
MAKRISGRTFIVGASVATLGLIAEAALTWVRKETPVLVENSVVVFGLGLCGLVVFVDEAAEDRSSSDPVMPGWQRDQVGVVAGCA